MVTRFDQPGEFTIVQGAFYGMVGMWDVDDYGCK